MIDPMELHALADGELSPSEAADLHRRLAASPDAQAELQSIMALKRALRDKVTVIDCRSEWKACLSRIDEIDRTRKVERFVGRYAWALCGALFLVIAAGGLQKRSGSTASVNTADLSRVVTSLSPRRVPPAQSEAREQWLNEIMGQARQSADPTRMEILGYSDGQLDGRPVTCLSLRDAVGDLALFVMPGVVNIEGKTDQQNPTFRFSHLQGLNCVSWTDGRYTLALVSGRSFDDIAQAAERLRVRITAR